MSELFDKAFDVLQDATVDTLYLIPFLLVTYLIMEWMESKTGAATQQAIRRAGSAGPAIGAILGVVPQCGFSAAASTLYAGRIVTFGTLFAVFLSTSDEMLPIFIAEQVPLGTMLAILGMKVLIALVFGFGADLVLRAAGLGHGHLHIHELRKCDDGKCSSGCEALAHDPELSYENNDEHADDCDHSHDAGWNGIAKSACKHTLQVALFVFLVSLALDAVLAYVGEEALGAFLGSNTVLSVVGAAIVGLIPNCAASVAIAQLYIEGVLGLGACMAGLLSAAGVGLLVLLRTNRNAAENAAIVCALVGVSVLCGLVIQASGLAL